MRLPVMDVEIPVSASDTAPECPAPRIPLQVRSHGRTDPGRVRDHNEDQFLIADLARALQARQSSLDEPDVRFSTPQGYLFLVADGVGGHVGGEKASALAVNTVESFILDTLNWCAKLHSENGNEVLSEFQRALIRADARLIQEARQRPELRGMATTVTLAYAVNDELFIAHVGDSRCYLMRNGVLFRLTNDHTLVDEMVRHGMIKPEDVPNHRLRHVVTNVVGGNDRGVKVEMHKLPLESHDRLLLCSDGLTEMVPEQEILKVLAAEEDPAAACEKLVDRANEAGGKDNVTVVVARFDA
jgi:serine/threonine protein phosphatase PrpC